MDRFGSLWVSFDRNAIYRLRDGSWTRAGGLAELPPDPALIELTDAKGRTWFGYRDNLLAMIDGTQVSRFDGRQGIDIGNVISIYEVAGQIYIGGDRGVWFVKN